MTHRYVFIALGISFAAVMFFSAFSGIFNNGSTSSGGPMQANEAADVPRSTPEGTVTAEAGLTPTPTVKRYTAAPALTIDQSKTYTATIKTTEGDIQISLDPKSNPEAVNAFIFLARDGYYDGTVFMQVNPEAPKFTAQAGDPTQTGLGTPGFTVSSVPTDKPFVRGALGYDRGQFFISYVDQPALNGKYAIIGSVTSGLDVLEKLTLLKVGQSDSGSDSVQSISVPEP